MYANLNSYVIFFCDVICPSFLKVAYQKNLQLAYVDKLLTDIQLEFRDKYREQLENGSTAMCDFDTHFQRLLKEAETEQKNKKTVMRSFDESKKAKKIRENRGELPTTPVKKSSKKTKDKNNGNDDDKENIPGINLILIFLDSGITYQINYCHNNFL